MGIRTAAIFAAIWGLVILITGCGRQTGDAAAWGNKKASASPKPSPSPTAITAVSTNANLTVYDEKGQIVYTLKAAAAGVSPSSTTNTIVVQGGNVTMYQQGKAAGTLTAKNLTANREARTVVATGEVVARSLTQQGSPTVRADRMVWDHDKNLLTGDGHVLMTAEPAYSLPAESFTADTKLSRYHVKLGDAPGSGSY